MRDDLTALFASPWFVPDEDGRRRLRFRCERCGEADAEPDFDLSEELGREIAYCRDGCEEHDDEG